MSKVYDTNFQKLELYSRYMILGPDWEHGTIVLVVMEDRFRLLNRTLTGGAHGSRFGSWLRQALWGAASKV